MMTYKVLDLVTYTERFPKNIKVTYHFFKGDWHKQDTYINGYAHDYGEHIDGLNIKDGYDLVQWENGNIGFLAYYSTLLDGFEIIVHEWEEA